MNFLNLPLKNTPYNQAKAVIQPIPYSGNIPAALAIDKGPELILKASADISPYDVETNTDITDFGVHTLEPFVCPQNPLEAVEVLAGQAALHHKKNKLVAGIGGSHIVTLGLVRGAMESHNNISVLHFGAHAHFTENEDVPCDESGIMARIKEICPVTQIGIRSMTKPERKKIHLDNLVLARDIFNNGLNAAADAIDLMSDKVYIAIHLDVLDPSCMPSVARPEPGGLDWYTLNALIRQVGREKKIVGFDLTGLTPQKPGTAANLLAAKLIYKVLICVMQNTL